MRALTLFLLLSCPLRAEAAQPPRVVMLPPKKEEETLDHKIWRVAVLSQHVGCLRGAHHLLDKTEITQDGWKEVVKFCKAIGNDLKDLEN